MVCSKINLLSDPASGCSCESEDNTLTCTCPDTHGVSTTTDLIDLETCQTTFVYDGRLGCFPFRGTGIPNCPAYTYKFGIVRAACNDGNGGTFITTIDITPCDDFEIDVDQTSKTLTCTKVLKSWT